MSEPQTSWRSRLAAPAFAALIVACCLAAPLIVGAAGTLTAGAALGIGAGVVALLALCLFLAGRPRSDKRC
jgi:hypothetical protein